MKRNLIFLCLIAVALNLKAQIVSLKSEELQALKALALKNDTVKNILNGFKMSAKKALNDVPNPVKKINSEGLLAGDPLKLVTQKSLQDISKVYALSLTYRLCDENKYLQKATDFLLAWATTNEASGNPINETKLENLIVGYDFIRDYFDTKDKNVIDRWLKTVADAEVSSKYADSKRGTSKNNWNSHRIKIVTLIAYTIHDKSYDSFIKSALEAQIAHNLYPDGTSIDFEDRDALHYHIYDLEPLLQAIIAIYRKNGEDYYNYESASGASIKKSVQFLVPFVSGEKTHVEFVNSKAAFDKARAANNEKGYQHANFIPSAGVYALSLANYFDHSFLNAVKNASKKEMALNWQLVLNRVRSMVN